MKTGGRHHFLSLVLPLVALTMVPPRSLPNPRPSQAENAASPTVFVVRHAEKGTFGPDPSLTSAGHRRAETLARVLEDAGITAIFSSEFKRSQETAAPLAGRLRLPVVSLPANDLDELASRVRGLPSTGRSLVVAHSNTLPLLVTRLTGVKVADLTDTDYDRLYVLTLRGDGRGDVVILHYGDSKPGTSSARGVAIQHGSKSHSSMTRPTLGSNERRLRMDAEPLHRPLSVGAPKSSDSASAP